MRSIRGAMILVLAFLIVVSFVFTDIAASMEIDFDNLCYRNSRLTDKFANSWTNKAGSAAWYVYGRIQESMHTTNKKLREAYFGNPLFSNDTHLWRVDVQALSGITDYYVFEVGVSTPPPIPQKGDIAVWDNGHVAFVEDNAGKVTESGIKLPSVPITPVEKAELVGKNIIINWDRICLRRDAGLKGSFIKYIKIYGVWEIVNGPVFTGLDPYAWYEIQESGNKGYVALQFSPNGQSMSRVFLQSHTPLTPPKWYLRIPTSPLTN